MPAYSFKEGDTIWSVDRWRNANEGHYETVKTVGRLNIYTESGVKINRLTLEDGFAFDSNRMYFPNKKAHDLYIKEEKEWRELNKRLALTRGTLSQAAQIKAVMGWNEQTTKGEK